MPRTKKSLSVSIQHWLSSAHLSNNVKLQIVKIRDDEFAKSCPNYDDAYQLISSIVIGKCDICGSDILLGSGCINAVGRKLPSHPSKGQLIHYNTRIVKTWNDDRRKMQSDVMQKVNQQVVGVKFCKKCGKETMHTGVGCMVCYNRSGAMAEVHRKIGNTVGKRNLQQAHIERDGWAWCDACQERTFHSVVGCMKCHNLGLNRFQRDQLKKTIEHLNIHLELQDRELKPLDAEIISNLNGVPGVWSIWGECDGKMQCLTVGQTSNMGNELYWVLRVLNNPNLQNMSDQEAGRWNLIQRYKNLKIHLIKQNVESYDERELVEAAYALMYQSLYWMPSPTQRNAVRTVLEAIKSVEHNANSNQYEKLLQLIGVNII